jgi:hypothetical protein
LIKTRALIPAYEPGAGHRIRLSDPDKRRALALLDVSDDISPPTRTASHEAMAEIADMLERARARGPMRDAPMGFVVAMANSVAETTMDFMVNDPAHADEHCQAGFDALGRLLGS